MNIRGLAILILLTLLPAKAGAQSDDPISDLSEYGDYEVDHKGWNGLSTLAALAEGSGLAVTQRTNIAWEELDSNDVVLLLYPTNHLDPSNMISFIRNGGRVLIADDFGSGAAILGQLGARRSDQVVAESYHDKHLFAPIASPVGKHPLSQGIVELTTNHPSVIRNLEGMVSVFRFESGSTLVATGEIGNGRYVVLSDPSVLINRMLQFEGNLQFAINLLRYLARPGQSDRIVVLSGAVNFAGLPRNRYDDGTWRGSASVVVARFDGWLDQLNSWLLTANSLRILTVIMALALAIWAFVVLPSKRKRPLDGSWTRTGQLNEDRGYERLIQNYEDTGARTSFMLPAAIARDNVNSALELILDTPDPLYALPAGELVARLQTARGTHAAGCLRSLLPRLNALPQRAQAAAHWQPRFLGRSEFEAIHGLAQQLFESLDSIKPTRTQDD